MREYRDRLPEGACPCISVAVCPCGPQTEPSKRAVCGAYGQEKEEERQWIRVKSGIFALLRI